MTDEQWLAGLKSGDEVALMNWVYPPSVARVTRVTKTLILVGAHRFSRTSGRNVFRGSHVGLDRLTPELRDEIEHSELVSKLVSHRWKNTPLATLRKVVELLAEAEK